MYFYKIDNTKKNAVKYKQVIFYFYLLIFVRITAIYICHIKMH